MKLFFELQIKYSRHFNLFLEIQMKKLLFNAIFKIKINKLFLLLIFIVIDCQGFAISVLLLQVLLTL